jgi:hypothetical protein
LTLLPLFWYVVIPCSYDSPLTKHIGEVDVWAVVFAMAGATSQTNPPKQVRK